jgi:hypothetical protein
MKNEIKLEFNNNQLLEHLIKKAYFKEGYKGKLLNNNNFIEITEKIDDVLYTVIKGLNNVTFKLSNEELIDGSCRFIIDDNGINPKIYPISMYCIIDDSSKKYIFY